MKNKAIPFTFSIVGIWFLIFFAIGPIFIFFGLKGNSNYKDYIEITGYYLEKEPADDNLYYLIYTYEVNGEIYKLTSNVQTNIIPKAETPTQVLYNPNNPKDAIIKDDNNFFLIFGVLWSLVCLAPIAMFKNKGLFFVLIMEVIYLFVYMFLNTLLGTNVLKNVTIISQVLIFLIGFIWIIIDQRKSHTIRI